MLSVADLGWPLEEVGFDDAFEIGMCVEGVAVKEIFRVVFRFVFDVDEEVLLEDEGDEGGEVGVTDEQPIGGVGIAGGVLTEGYFEEVLP